MAKTQRINKQGRKTITITLRLWTNNIAEEEGKVQKKHALSKGTIEFKKNLKHGIEPKKLYFQTLAELPAKLEEGFIKQGIKIHPSQRERKYR